MIVPRTAIGDFVNHDWFACCDRRASDKEVMVHKSSGNAIVCCNRVYQGLRRELWQLENSLCPRQGEAYDAGGLK